MRLHLQLFIRNEINYLKFIAEFLQDNFFEWEAAITGPEGSPFEDGVFIARLVFPQDYPLNPPSMRFTSKIFHPNIYPDGKVCISILHPPGDDPTGYEKSSERWSPVQSVEKVR